MPMNFYRVYGILALRICEYDVRVGCFLSLRNKTMPTSKIPVLIPRYCVSGLNTLTDSHVRKEVGILEGNPYVFPNTENSQFHVLGWNTTRKMCEHANVDNPELLTASKQRHRSSTIYAALDVPEVEREHFYKHMGHSKSVNIGTYQYPLPLLEMTKVGRHIQDIDEGIYKTKIIHYFLLKMLWSRFFTQKHRKSPR